MRAAIFDPSSAKPGAWLTLEERPTPEVRPGEMLLKVIACGVCRTDLHILEGDLRPIHNASCRGTRLLAKLRKGRQQNCRWVRAPGCQKWSSRRFQPYARAESSPSTRFTWTECLRSL